MLIIVLMLVFWCWCYYFGVDQQGCIVLMLIIFLCWFYCFDDDQQSCIVLLLINWVAICLCYCFDVDQQGCIVLMLAVFVEVIVLMLMIDQQGCCIVVDVVPGRIVGGCWRRRWQLAPFFSETVATSPPPRSHPVYLYKLLKHICPNCKKYLSKLQDYLSKQTPPLLPQSRGHPQWVRISDQKAKRAQKNERGQSEVAPQSACVCETVDWRATSCLRQKYSNHETKTKGYHFLKIRGILQIDVTMWQCDVQPVQIPSNFCGCFLWRGAQVFPKWHLCTHI